MRLVRYPDFLTLLQVVPQLFLVTDIVMTVTIHLKAILMVGTAVDLTSLQHIAQYVNVLSLQLQQLQLLLPQQVNIL